MIVGTDELEMSVVAPSTDGHKEGVVVVEMYQLTLMTLNSWFDKHKGI